MVLAHDLITQASRQEPAKPIGQTTQKYPRSGATNTFASVPNPNSDFRVGGHHRFGYAPLPKRLPPSALLHPRSFPNGQRRELRRVPRANCRNRRGQVNRQSQKISPCPAVSNTHTRRASGPITIPKTLSAHRSVRSCGFKKTFQKPVESPSVGELRLSCERNTRPATALIYYE